MNVNEVSINQVFLSNRTLRIPYFQRPYVWEEKNWEKFYNDIAEIAMAINDSPETYFMGSIILKKSKFLGVQQFDVIDGQQRLTTIVLFMKSLLLFLNRNDLFNSSFMQQTLAASEPILVPSHNDSLTYKKIIGTTKLEKEAINDSNMAKAYAYFVNRISASYTGEDKDYKITPQCLYDTAINYVKLVCIELERDENAQKIFETINCTGIRLTTGEMLKNYLYDETRIAEYEQSWKKIFEGNNLSYWNDDIIKGRLGSNHINNFFYRYMLIKMQEPEIKENLTANEIKNYRKQDGLFEKFKNLIEKNNLSINSIIQDVIKCAELYMRTFKKEILDEALVMSPGLERLVALMFAQDSWTMTPYILYILKNQPDINERLDIFRYMETYLIRRIFCKSKNNNYSDLFSENLIGQGIITAKDFMAYVSDSVARGNLLMPSDDDLKKAIMNEDQKRDANVLLYMLESKINNSFKNGDYTNGFYDFVAEQIMPEKDNAAWATTNYSHEDRDRLTRTIGNFVLLREKLKTSDKKANWTTKKNKMKDKSSKIEISGILHRGLNSFSEESIEKRNEWIAQKAITLWPL